LRLNDELDASALLERLCEVALLAPGNYVVAELLPVAVVNHGDSEGGVLATVLGSAADGWVADGAEEGDGLLGLHGVSPFARSIGTHPKGRERCAAPKSRHRRVAKRRSFWKGTRSLRGGRSPKPGGRGTRVLNAEPKGAAPAPKRWPSERATGDYAG
jgi:hypothetical protein